VNTAIAFHPASDIFPLMEGEDLEDLAQDIREHGLREPITLHSDGSILDGRNRYRACLRVGIEPRFTTWQDDGSPVSFVISLNLKRRQLTPGQLGMIGLKAKPLLAAEARERQRVAGRPPGHGGEGSRSLPPMGGKGESNELAGKLVGVSAQTIQRADMVDKRGIQELVEAVKSGEMTVRAAADIATLPEKEQHEVVAASAVNVSARSVENKSSAPAAAGATSGTPEPPTPPRPAAGVVRYEDAAPR